MVIHVSYSKMVVIAACTPSPIPKVDTHHEKVITLVFDYNCVYFILFVNFVKAIIFFIGGFTI